MPDTPSTPPASTPIATPPSPPVIPIPAAQPPPPATPLPGTRQVRTGRSLEDIVKDREAVQNLAQEATDAVAQKLSPALEAHIISGAIGAFMIIVANAEGGFTIHAGMREPGAFPTPEQQTEINEQNVLLRKIMLHKTLTCLGRADGQNLNHIKF